MSNLQEVVAKVNRALESPVNELEIQKAMILLHNQLAEPKWAIEDEKLRDDYEKLLVQLVVHNYRNNISRK